LPVLPTTFFVSSFLRFLVARRSKQEESKGTAKIAERAAQVLYDGRIAGFRIIVRVRPDTSADGLPEVCIHGSHYAS